MPDRQSDHFKYLKNYKQYIKSGADKLKVIYSDLDGTLFNDQGCVIKDAEQNYYFGAVRLLDSIEKKGWDLVIVSGRNKHQLRYNAQMIGIDNYISEIEIEYGENDLIDSDLMVSIVRKLKEDFSNDRFDCLIIGKSFDDIDMLIEYLESM